MPRTVSRSEPMNESIVFRGTANDKAQVKLAAQQQGMDTSAFIRYLLIKEKIINPLGVSNDKANW